MLSSLYNDTSSESSAATTPVRHRQTPQRSGASLKQSMPFKSPLLTPLRSPSKPSPLVKQYQATSAVINRIFTSNALFRVTLLFLPIFITILIFKLYPYTKMEKCDGMRHMWYCIKPETEEFRKYNMSKIIRNIMRSQHPKTFEELYAKITQEYQEKYSYNFTLDSIKYSTDVALVDGNIIIYKLSNKAEIIILVLLNTVTLATLVTCLIFRHKNKVK